MHAPAALPRSVPLERSSNLRDLGGWPAADGRVVRGGRLYRSAALAALSPADVETLRGLGLRTVCDFRGRKERNRAPTAARDVRIVSLPIEPTVGASLRDLLATRNATGESMMSLMERAYLAYALGCTAQYRAFFALLLDGARLPLVFHCSAGKDRTGFAAALVLSALGASWETVMADYLATNRLWRRDTVLSHDLPPAVAEVLLGAHGNLLEAAFAGIRKTDGTVEKYLERALGVGEAERERLRAELLA